MNVADYLKPNAVVPVDMETTRALVEYARELRNELARIIRHPAIPTPEQIDAETNPYMRNAMMARVKAALEPSLCRVLFKSVPTPPPGY